MHLLNPNDMVVVKSSEGGKHSKKEIKELLEVHCINLTVIISIIIHHIINQTMIKLYFCFYYISINIPKSKQLSIQIWKGNKKKKS